MQALPHIYTASAGSTPNGNTVVQASDLPDINTAPPVEFDGPGGQWSPEALLVGAIADCFALTFRAVAVASRLEWQALDCTVDGVLERADGKVRFTQFTVRARVTVARESDIPAATRLMQKAEANCLVSNSLIAPVSLEAEAFAA